ncbi:hypothetical protein ASPSYDRAFT_93551 [Aspergillus sydowii CBS 593.65]|uniref:Uncharacterized protein n=1 Tax=Aspergillus sydowii CBS 593.65 TaxID=1036612 RepID=A0A1L9T5C6_9EURO|nr:uncharacterized protein ASPSYDRAFT_93551 [Aspergillus sydowii CBS 593.65]OJJ54636.1 hypothetical protein ASPSYDRAFT_93551 [Aspergillus sydowii CBS 593.65]
MSPKDTRKCPKCQGPVQDSCIDQKHLGPLPVLPLNIGTTLIRQSTTEDLSYPTPRCPTCAQTIRPECLINKHIIPCRACGLSFAYRPPSHDGFKEASYLDWAYRDAINWLETQTGHKAGLETTNKTEDQSEANQSGEAITTTDSNSTTHACIARKLERRKERNGEGRGVAIAGHLEWGRTLNSLREITPLGEEVPAAVRALVALKEECDATYAMLELVRMSDPARQGNS